MVSKVVIFAIALIAIVIIGIAIYSSTSNAKNLNEIVPGPLPTLNSCPFPVYRTSYSYITLNNSGLVVYKNTLNDLVISPGENNQLRYEVHTLSLVQSNLTTNAITPNVSITVTLSHLNSSNQTSYTHPSLNISYYAGVEHIAYNPDYVSEGLNPIPNAYNPSLNSSYTALLVNYSVIATIKVSPNAELGTYLANISDPYCYGGGLWFFVTVGQMPYNGTRNLTINNS